uniref:BED-type domain-containing protein n=1 Tax=Romanomermis culicivorax TaxID=13658 RepID=A0A915JAP5_ROMCU
MVGKSTFKIEWMNNSIHHKLALWIHQSPKGDQSSAYCILCKKVFDISTMGRQALTSHAKSKKPISTLAANQRTQSLRRHLTTPVNATNSTNSQPNLTTPLELVIDEDFATTSISDLLFSRPNSITPCCKVIVK